MHISALVSTILLVAIVTPAQASNETPPARKTVVNSLKMTMVEIPAGEFVMGLSETPEELARAFPLYREPSPEGNHLPRVEELVDMTPHKVRITRHFFMGAHEVTIGQFRRFVDDAGYRTEPERDNGGYGVDPETKEWTTKRDPRYSWRFTGFPQGDDHPVVNVTWADAVAFCDWLGKKEGKHYRLPTEAEWEYACRAGTTTRYNFGDDPEDLAKNANTYDASCAKVFPEWAKWAIRGDDGHPFTAPVGSFKPSAFGLYDMHGNVWEWCSDWYGPDYYTKSPLEDPQGPPTGRPRSRRGGGWHVWSLYAMSCYRNYNFPPSRYVNLGFRVVMDADP